ncbi:MAG: hypothetical protein WD021_05430, partial [Rhodothermales bacterium]
MYEISTCVVTRDPFSHVLDLHSHIAVTLRHTRQKITPVEPRDSELARHSYAFRSHGFTRTDFLQPAFGTSRRGMQRRLMQRRL